jgi:hypothetical protein
MTAYKKRKNKADLCPCGEEKLTDGKLCADCLREVRLRVWGERLLEMGPTLLQVKSAQARIVRKGHEMS